MGKSYKKMPYCGDEGTKSNKKVANRTVRRKLKEDTELVLNNKQYKKAYESWNIVDYYSKSTWEEYWNFQLECYRTWTSLGIEGEMPDKKKCYREWYKAYKMK